MYQFLIILLQIYQRILLMLKTIISDTSCFILLNKIGHLDLLQKVYGTIITTVEILQEWGEPLPEWVIIHKVNDISKQQILEMQVDKGEASAIALALETPGSTLIIDDYRARKVAQKLNLKFTGTIGVLVKAKLTGVIPLIKPYLELIIQTNFRITAEIEQQALKEVGESID